MITFVERIACPLCGGKDFRVLIERGFDAPDMQVFFKEFYVGRAQVPKGRYALAECICGGVWQKNILNDAGMEALYGRWIDPSESFKKKTAAHWDLYRKYAREVQFIEKLFPKKVPCEINVLDFGAGWGMWLQMARAHGLKGMGVEIAADRILYAQTLGIELVPTLEDLSHGILFDFINAEQVFEHVADPRSEITALIAKLRPGGVMHIAVPNGEPDIIRARKGLWRPVKGATQPLEHVNAYTAKSLDSFLKHHGLVYVDDGSAAFRGRTAAFHSFMRKVRGPYTTSQYVRKT